MKTVTRVAPRVDDMRETLSTMTVNGRHVERGTELTVTAIRGRCTFLAHVKHVNGNEWVDVITSRGFARTVRPDAIRVVHTRRRTFAAV